MKTKFNSTHRWVHRAGVMAGGVALVTLLGCVLREEKIKIRQDGSATIALDISGETKELTNGDAMPSVHTGWNVERKTEIKDGKEELTLSSKRTFAPGEPLPRTFASPDTPDAKRYLDFPTTIRLEDRADGRYYFFRRVYTERPWAYMQYWKDMCFDEDVKKLGEKPVEELTYEERRQIAEAMVCDEAYSQIALAKEALQEIAPDLPIEYRLQARQALMDFYRTDRHVKYDAQGNVIESSEDYLDRLIKKCADLPQKERDTCYDEEATKILRTGLDTYMNALQTSAGWAAQSMDQFQAAYDRARKRFENTEQVGAHMFGITVTLPGTIVAYNGDKSSYDNEDNTSDVQWEFKGSVMRDRSHELIAISKLTWEQVNRNDVDARDR